jgi:hypothetical protein
MHVPVYPCVPCIAQPLHLQYVIHACSLTGTAVAEPVTAWDDNALLKGAFVYSIVLCGLIALGLVFGVALLLRKHVVQRLALLKVGVSHAYVLLRLLLFLFLRQLFWHALS